MRVGDQVIEPLIIHRKTSREQAWQRGIEALRAVGIQDAERRMRTYPHEFSGGMRQRLMIATALITKPALLIADEPTTALDVTVQAQILELIRKMQRELGTAVIFVTHDIGIVIRFLRSRARYVCRSNRERARPPRRFFTNQNILTTRRCKNPYLRSTKKGRHFIRSRVLRLDLLRADSRSVHSHYRCEYAQEKCTTSTIALKEIAPGHFSACLRIQLKEIDLAPAQLLRSLSEMNG